MFLTHRNFLAGLLVGVGIPCSADPILECSASASSQVEIRDCMTIAETQSEAALTLALSFSQQSAEDLDTVTGRPNTVKTLNDAQNAWTVYRAAHCKYVGSTFGGGSGTGIAILGCRIQLTRDRVAVLMQSAT